MLSSSFSEFIVPAVLWSLVVMSVITWALLGIKLWQFSHIRRANNRFKQAFWSAEGMAAGQACLDTAQGPMARIAQAGFAVLTNQDLAQGMPVLREQIDRQDRLERALQRAVRYERRGQEAWTVLLASFGSTAPFVGLFGTVWGIMEALISIADTGSTGLDAVAGPVGHALIATAMGIAVAVPAVLIYNFLARRLNANVNAMRNFTHDFYNLCQQAGFKVSDTEQAG